MSYLGLTPSEYSTGNTRRLGGIYPGRQCPRRAYPHRGRLGLSLQRQGEPSDATTSRDPPPSDPRHRLEGPGAPLQALPQARGQGEASQRRGRGDRTRARGVHVGHRPASAPCGSSRHGSVRKGGARGRTPCGPGVNVRKKRGPCGQAAGQGPSCPPLAHTHSPLAHTAPGKGRCVPIHPLQQSFDKTTQDPMWR